MSSSSRPSYPVALNIDFRPPRSFAVTWLEDDAQALCLLSTLVECVLSISKGFSRKLLDWFHQGCYRTSLRGC